MPCTPTGPGVNRSKGKALQRKRGELIERSFAHILETGGHRRVRLRGRANITKRYLIHVAGFNLSVVLRKGARLRVPERVRERPRAPLCRNSRPLGYHPSCERSAVVPAAYPQVTNRYAER